MSEQFTLKKGTWSEEDFDAMGWHDCWIHGIAFFSDEFELALDIDYIFRWEAPEKDGGGYRFWIAPATMVFKNVHDVVMDVNTSSGLQVADLARTGSETPRNATFEKQVEWTWDVDCQEGHILLKSTGFDMYVRSSPILIDSQEIKMSARGGISFARVTAV